MPHEVLSVHSAQMIVAMVGMLGIICIDRVRESACLAEERDTQQCRETDFGRPLSLEREEQSSNKQKKDREAPLLRKDMRQSFERSKRAVRSTKTPSNEYARLHN